MWMIWKPDRLPPIFPRREKIDLADHDLNAEVCGEVWG